jgi:hypothetical protein
MGGGGAWSGTSGDGSDEAVDVYVAETDAGIETLAVAVPGAA